MPSGRTARRTRRGSLHSLICFVVLIAFTAQDYLIQTHIHALPHAWTESGPTVTKRTPAPLDANKCPLCQEYLHAGLYLTPSAVAALLPTAAVSLLPFIIAPLTLARAVSHNWMGRAPPSL